MALDGTAREMAAEMGPGRMGGGRAAAAAGALPSRVGVSMLQVDDDGDEMDVLSDTA